MPKTKNPHLYVVWTRAPESQEATQIHDSPMLKTMVDQETPEIKPTAMMSGGHPVNLGYSQRRFFTHTLFGVIPVDVFGIEDLSGSGSVVDCEDGCGSEVRGHGEVGYGANEEGDGEEVMEDLLPPRSEEGQANDDKK